MVVLLSLTSQLETSSQTQAMLTCAANWSEDLAADWRLSRSLFNSLSYMTQSIPSSFSSDELQELLANARHEDDCRCEQCEPAGEGPFGEQGLTEEQVSQIAFDLLDQAQEKCDDPIVHKIMFIMIANNMLAWHSKMGVRFAEQGDGEQAMGWLRDAGKFQAILNILDTISVGPNDFTTDVE